LLENITFWELYSTFKVVKTIELGKNYTEGMPPVKKEGGKKLPDLQEVDATK